MRTPIPTLFLVGLALSLFLLLQSDGMAQTNTTEKLQQLQEQTNTQNSQADTEVHLGNLQGRIIDAKTKQPLIGAVIAVHGTKRGSTTNQDGEFLIKQLPENVYKLKISYVGYAGHVENDVRVIRNKTIFVREIELTPSPIILESVAVRPEIATVPISSHTFDGEEIRRAPGTAGDIFRALGALPGVSSSEGEFSAMSVRGAGVHDNLILVDNIPLEKINHFEGGSREQEAQGGRFSVFTSGLLDQVTFYGGGFGADFGGKSASVLDLSIREGNLESPIISGSYDLLGLELNYDGPSYLLKNTSLLVNMRDFDAKRAMELADQEDFGDPTLGDFIAKSTSYINAANKVSVLGIYSTDRLLRGTRNLAKADDLVENDLWDIDETRWLLGANWRLLTSKNSVLQNTLYFRSNERFRSYGYAYADAFNGQLPPDESGFNTRENVGTQNEDEREFGWKSNMDFAFDNGSSLNFGLELQSMELDYGFVQDGADTLYRITQQDQLVSPDQKFVVLQPENVNYNYDGAAATMALYSNYEFTLKRFILRPGVRYSYNGFNERSVIEPRMQVRYQLTSSTMLNAASGVYYQRPLNRHIAASITSSALRDERSIHYIGGLTHMLSDDLRFTLEGYYKTYDDLITPTNQADNGLTNNGEGWSSGFDAILLKRLTNKYYAQLTYSYAVSKRDDNDGFGEYTSSSNQPHNITAMFGYEINDEWFVSAKWKYNTGRPKDKYIVHANVLDNQERLRYSQEITERNGARLKDFHLLSVRVDYRKQLGPVGLVTFLELDNIYDQFNSWEDRFSELSGEERGMGLGFFANFGFKIEI